MTNKYWFKPKSFGYGATPITWEGWLATALLIALIIWRSLYIELYPIRFIVELAFIIIAFTIFAKSKTEGEWTWQWGKKN